MQLIKVAAAVLNQTPLDWDGNLEHIRQAIQQARSQQQEQGTKAGMEVPAGHDTLPFLVVRPTVSGVAKPPIGRIRCPTSPSRSSSASSRGSPDPT